jgi:uncharacterized membrane protein (UPF0127 family)
MFKKRSKEEKSAKSKKMALILAGVITLTTVFLWFWQLRFPEAVVEIKDQKLTVLLAKNPKHHYRGLGNRESMAPYDGMLFVFGYSRSIGIVMRDMQFPIDIVWFQNGKVVDIAPNVQTEPGVGKFDLRVYRPRIPANSVLELPAGWTKENDLRIGDNLQVIDE